MPARIDVLVERFPQTAPLMAFYARLANRAAGRLGLEVVPRAKVYVRERLIEAGVLPSRRQLPDFLNRRGLAGTGVEVGVRLGIFSEAILDRWRGAKLISVDPWLEAEEEYLDIANVEQSEHDRYYEQAVARLRRFGERSEIWRMTSVEGAARVEPHSLDFVYIDARHDYESVLEDLEHWFDKVRPGGVLAGHDYVDATWPQGVFGVKSAVDEFFGARGLTVHPTYADAPPTWVVQVPASPGP
jgi:predicted O-methyltransferase YrrM